ncbi:MAG: hypothetical protein LLF76_06710 [Planctomycetaceae bacterium]|nr:hypothetical protein [Planctomycetaceae bacterium]
MGFNPLKEKGIPIEKQAMNWSALNVEPYDKNHVHPYTHTRVILMNGIEVEAAMFKHQFARHCSDMDVREQLALTRRVEQQQQKLINWLIPGDETPLETTIGYEQVAVDLTAWLAKTERDPMVKSALDFALIEDFDHLYRYANLLELSEGKQAQAITRELTEIMPGRPTELEHRHPYDTVRRAANAKAIDILSLLHILTIVSAEQQTMNFYMNLGNHPISMLGRGLYLEIAMVEEQHVSHYESLMDPTTSWFEQCLLHEYNECYMYYSCMESETDTRIRKIWQRCLDEEITHVQMAAEMLKKYDKKDPAMFIKDKLPELTVFQSNKDYVRDIIASQINLTTIGPDYVPAEDLPADARYHEYQKVVNYGGNPSHQVIQENIKANGNDYRLETQGPHPVERFRLREVVEV